MAAFVPRTVFPTLDSLPRSYFLGHHRAGLDKMKTMLSTINLIIECRDYRIPITSRNPLFEHSLAGRERLIIYTKQDLGSKGKETDRIRENIISKWHHPSSVLFSNFNEARSIRKVLKFAQDHAHAADSLLSSRLMVVGMPNVGKSSLLNALRKLGVQKGKAAQTGAQPGVTRKIATSVKISEATSDSESIYLVDTPGVFIPYVPNAESMLKLALCGSVKDTIIAPEILADYLLFHLNLQSPRLYREYAEPTNDVNVFLEGIAKKTGRLQKGGVPDSEASALWAVQRWRTGHLGKFCLDQVSDEALDEERRTSESQIPSVSQARHAQRLARSVRSKGQIAAG